MIIAICSQFLSIPSHETLNIDCKEGQKWYGVKCFKGENVCLKAIQQKKNVEDKVYFIYPTIIAQCHNYLSRLPKHLVRRTPTLLNGEIINKGMEIMTSHFSIGKLEAIGKTKQFSS